MDWHAIVTVVLTSSVLGGVISAVVGHFLTGSRAERDFRRKKLEELFLAIDGWCTAFRILTIPWKSAAAGKVSYNQAVTQVLEFGDKYGAARKRRDHETATMLVKIYFRELDAELEDLMAERDQAAAVQDRIENKCRETPGENVQTGLAKEFEERIQKLTRSQDSFNRALFVASEPLVQGLVDRVRTRWEGL